MFGSIMIQTENTAPGSLHKSNYIDKIINLMSHSPPSCIQNEPSESRIFIRNNRSDLLHTATTCILFERFFLNKRKQNLIIICKTNCTISAIAKLLPVEIYCSNLLIYVSSGELISLSSPDYPICFYFYLEWH